MDIIGIVKIGTDLPLLNIVYDHEESLWKKIYEKLFDFVDFDFFYIVSK